MAKQKHWAVPTTFKVHGERAGDAQKLVERLVERLVDEAESGGLVVVTVHRPTRMRGPADTCAECKAE